MRVIPVTGVTRLSCLLLVALAGCSGVPHGYELVEAVVEPDGRPVAIVPFGARRGGITAVDGIKLAELAAMDLRANLQGLQVVGPSGMRESLKEGVNEAHWPRIGREAGAQLIVAGDVTFLETYHDKLIQSREGIIGFSFRVLDVSTRQPEVIARVRDLRFSFPMELGDKFDTEYVSMDDATFRSELIRFGAHRLASFFYDHLEKKETKSRLQVDFRVERPPRDR